jgi:hypothetical protein
MAKTKAKAKRPALTDTKIDIDEAQKFGEEHAEEVRNKVKAKPEKTVKAPTKAKRKKPDLKPTSFRLNENDKDRLKKIVAEVNELSNRKVSETLVIQALLFNARNIDPYKLIKTIQKIAYYG